MENTKFSHNPSSSASHKESYFSHNKIFNKADQATCPCSLGLGGKTVGRSAVYVAGLAKISEGLGREELFVK